MNDMFTAATHLVIVLCTTDSSTDGYGGTDSKTQVGQPRRSPLRFMLWACQCASVHHPVKHAGERVAGPPAVAWQATTIIFS